MDEWCFYIEPHLPSQSLVQCLQSSACVGQWMDKATADVLERLELKNARVVDHSLSQMDEMHKDPQVLLRSRFFRFETDSVRNKLQKQICYCPQAPSLSSDHWPFLHKGGLFQKTRTRHRMTHSYLRQHGKRTDLKEPRFFRMDTHFDDKTDGFLCIACRGCQPLYHTPSCRACKRYPCLGSAHPTIYTCLPTCTHSIYIIVRNYRFYPRSTR